jgi:hypothetical protein
LHKAIFSVRFRSIFIDEQRKEKMSDTSSSRELYEEIHQRTVGKYGIIEVPSDKARDLVERVVAADSSHDIPAWRNRVIGLRFAPRPRPLQTSHDLV